MSSSVVTAFVGGLQASVAVLLTISYGAAAAQFRILSEASAKDISKLCVKLFLPALLATSVGSQLKSESIWAYMLVLGALPLLPALVQPLMFPSPYLSFMPLLLFSNIHMFHVF
jgi:predicted permease